MLALRFRLYWKLPLRISNRKSCQERPSRTRLGLRPIFLGAAEGAAEGALLARPPLGFDVRADGHGDGAGEVARPAGVLVGTTVRSTFVGAVAGPPTRVGFSTVLLPPVKEAELAAELLIRAGADAALLWRMLCGGLGASDGSAANAAPLACVKGGGGRCEGSSGSCSASLLSLLERLSGHPTPESLSAEVLRAAAVGGDLEPYLGGVPSGDAASMPPRLDRRWLGGWLGGWLEGSCWVAGGSWPGTRMLTVRPCAAPVRSRERLSRKDF